MDVQSVVRAMAAGDGHVWVVRCSSDVPVPGLVADGLAVGVLVEYREGSVVYGHRASVSVDDNLRVGELGDGNWGQAEIASHPSPVGSVFLRTNGGARQTANESGRNEAHQWEDRDGVELAGKDREHLRDERDEDVDEFEVVLERVALEGP
jgi:hypothetical protein